MTKTLVLLTLDEIEGLKSLFDKIPRDSADEVICIDGGSKDGTREFLEERNVPIITQEQPGRGVAFRTALERSQGRLLLFFSPDGNEDPSDIPLMFQMAEKGYDIVIGSRFMKGGKNEEDGCLFPLRALVNRAFTWLANVLWNTGDYVTDAINGFRVVSRDALLRLNTDEPGFPIEYQMTVRAMKLHMRIGQLPTVEGPRTGGEVKARSFPTGLGHLKVFFGEILNGYDFERKII